MRIWALSAAVYGDRPTLLQETLLRRFDLPWLQAVPILAIFFSKISSGDTWIIVCTKAILHRDILPEALSVVTIILTTFLILFLSFTCSRLCVFPCSWTLLSLLQRLYLHLSCFTVYNYTLISGPDLPQNPLDILHLSKMCLRCDLVFSLVSICSYIYNIYCSQHANLKL